MLKASITLALLGLLLLAVSFLPWQSGTEPETRAATRAERVAEGRALFLAKGCVTCHRHDDAAPPSSSIEVGTALTNYEPDEAFVRRWLRDPQAVRPTTIMPNLQLEEAEIEALIAFLSAP